MNNKHFDALFHLASHGEESAYGALYSEFINRANSKINSVIRNNSNFQGFPVDFCELIDELFFKVLNEYGPEKGSYSSFVSFILTRRLVPEVKKEIGLMQAYATNVDFDHEDENDIELLSDPDQKLIVDDLAMANFKQVIASPNVHKDKKRRMRDKVLFLHYAGFKKEEICKHLNITYAQLRRILEKAREDDDILNIKLDLK